MARLYAQLCTLLFAVLGLGGLALGDYGAIHHGLHGGNLGGLTLMLTWWRDAIDIGLLALFAYVGFVAGRHTGRLLVYGAGALLLLLAAAGVATRSAGIGPLHFPPAINILDAVLGLLAVLSALGTLEDPEPRPLR